MAAFMTNDLEFAVEQRAIDLSYDTKINEFENRLHELDAQDADLRMKLNGNAMERAKLQSLINEVERARQEEQLALMRKQLAKQK